MGTLAIADLRANRALFACVVAAAVVVVLAVVLALARFAGIAAPKPVVTDRPAAAMPAVPKSDVPTELTLTPGEKIVNPVESGPLMPSYATPTPPPPAPKTDEPQPAPPQKAAPAPHVENRAAAPKPPPAIAAPRTPGFAQGDAHPTSPFDTWPNSAPNVCGNCGRVEAVTVWPDMAEVRVRFEDGRRRVVRTAVPTRWHVGDTVRLERGRLVRD